MNLIINNKFNNKFNNNNKFNFKLKFKFKTQVYPKSRVIVHLLYSYLYLCR